MSRVPLRAILILSLSALCAEMTVLSLWTPLGARLELLFLLAAFSALYARDRSRALWTCWALGLVKDLGTAGPPGLSAFLFVVFAAALQRIRNSLYHDPAFTHGLLAGLAAGSFVLLHGAITALAAGSAAGISLGSRSLGAALLAALTGPLLFAALRRPRWRSP